MNTQLLEKSKAIKDEQSWRTFMGSLSDTDFRIVKALQEAADAELGRQLVNQIEVAIRKVLDPARKKFGKHHVDAAPATLLPIDDAETLEDTLLDLDLCYDNTRDYKVA